MSGPIFEYETRFLSRAEIEQVDASIKGVWEAISRVDAERAPQGWRRVWTDHTGCGSFIVYRRTQT